MKVRRVTTGHNAHGKAIVASDTEVDGIALTQLPGAEFHRLWAPTVRRIFPTMARSLQDRATFRRWAVSAS